MVEEGEKMAENNESNMVEERTTRKSSKKVWIVFIILAVVVAAGIAAFVVVERGESLNGETTKEVSKGIFPEYEVVKSADGNGQMLYVPYIKTEDYSRELYCILYGEYIVGANDQYTVWENDTESKESTQYFDIIVKNINTQEEYTISLTDYMKKNDLVRNSYIFEAYEIGGEQWVSIGVKGGTLYINPLTGEIIQAAYGQTVTGWGYPEGSSMQSTSSSCILLERDELLELPDDDSIFTNYPDLKKILAEMPYNDDLYFFTFV